MGYELSKGIIDDKSLDEFFCKDDEEIRYESENDLKMKTEKIAITLHNQGLNFILICWITANNFFTADYSLDYNYTRENFFHYEKW